MTKSSSSRKHRSRSHSKFSLLRKKLTLGVKKSPVQGVSSNRVDQALVAQNVQSTKTFHRTSPMKLVRLYKSMSTEQVELIKKWGYGGLVEIVCSKLQPDLCKYLMKCFDPTTCKLVFPGRGSIDVTEEAVQQVMGVPRGDMDVRYEMDADAISFMNKQLGNVGKLQPKISFLEKKLAAMETADSTYLRLFIIYGVCSVIAPTTGTHLSPRVYPSLVRIKNVNRLNMCKFIISMLREAAESREEEGIMKSCMLFFMVKYLDSLQLKYMDISSEGTRVSVWTNAMVRKAISQDQRSDGSFVLAPVKDEFASTDTAFQSEQGTSKTTGQEEGAELNNSPLEQEEKVDSPAEEEMETEEPTGDNILFQDDSRIDLFIEKHAPDRRTAKETKRYKMAVKEACVSFESTLKMLVRSLAYRPEKKIRKRKKRSAKRSAEKPNSPNDNVIHDTPPIATQSPLKPQSLDTSDGEFTSDEAFTCNNLVEDSTQITVSLDHESVDLSLMSTFEEDARCKRRKKELDLLRQMEILEEWNTMNIHPAITIAKKQLHPPPPPPKMGMGIMKKLLNKKLSRENKGTLPGTRKLQHQVMKALQII